MANNLSIENLSRSITIDGAGAFGGSGGVASEGQVLREMQKNGMAAPTQASPAGESSNTFVGMLRESLDKVNEAQTQADSAIKELVAGRSKNIHETMLTIEKADASLKMAMQVRNKILDAYREIMRMQV